MSISRHLLPFLLPMLLIGLTPALTAQERTPQLQAEVEKLQGGIEDFFKGFHSPTIGPEQAFNTLVGKGPLKKNEELTALIDKARKLEERYGRHAGHDVASVNTVGNDLVMLRYLYKGERYPTVWHFYYYRTANGTMVKEWSLIEIRFDTNLEGLDR